MWTQDWLRRFRSGKIVSAELTGRNDAAIANRQSTLADADLKIVTHDDEDDGFVIVHADNCELPGNSVDASHIKAPLAETRIHHDHLQPEQDPEETFICRASVHAMDLCGRGDHNHNFQDLRSASQAIKRDQNTRRKYYNFKYVKPGDLGASHGEMVGLFGNSSESQTEHNQSIVTKSKLYKQAQLPPRPPKYHRRHIDKIRGTISHRVDSRREARKHGKAIMKDHLKDL